MDPLYWVIAAQIAVWIGLGGYVIGLGLKQRQIMRRLNRLERNIHA